MTAIPLEVLGRQVFFFVPDGILPVGLHGDSGSNARSLHEHENHLGLKVQVSFKGEWAHVSSRKHGSTPF